MKSLLVLCGFLTVGYGYILNAQIDDRYATDNPEEKREINTRNSEREDDSSTSYLSYEDDISYTSRINRFHRPMISSGYWSGVYDPFWDVTYFAGPGFMYSPWSSWGFTSWYSPYSYWGWNGFGLGFGFSYGYGWYNPYRPWGYWTPGWGYYGWNNWNYGPSRHPNRNTRGLTTGPRRTTIGERPNSNMRYENGTRTRSIEGSRNVDSRQNNRNNRINDNSISPSRNGRNYNVAPRNNSNINSQPSRNTQPSRNNYTPSTPSRNYTPSSTPSRGGSNFSAPSRSGRGR